MLEAEKNNKYIYFNTNSAKIESKVSLYIKILLEEISCECKD